MIKWGFSELVPCVAYRLEGVGNVIGKLEEAQIKNSATVMKHGCFFLSLIPTLSIAMF